MLSNLSFRAKVLIGVALACAGYVIWMPDAGDTVEPARVGSTSALAENHAHALRSTSVANSSSPLVRISFAGSLRVVKDTAAAALFGAHSWFVAPPAPPPAPVIVQAPPAPSAPPLPFAFMGTYKTDGAQVYFLTMGDRVYDVKVGDKLNNTYSVDEVKGGQMMLTYLPLKIQQSLNVGEE